MNETLAIVQAVLDGTGYSTRAVPENEPKLLMFEGDSVLGGVWLFESGTELLKEWRAREEAFLRSNALRLRAAGEKAWNVYSIFLAEHAAESAVERQVQRIEEDLSHTRKLAATGIGTRMSVVRALLALLPLQAVAVVEPAEVEGRLRRRLDALRAGSAELILNDTVDPTQVLRLLRQDNQ